MRSSLRVVLLMTGALALTACTSLPSHAPSGAPDETAWEARQGALMALKDWELSGRVAIADGKDGGSGSLDWQQQDEVLRFDFSGPFGAGAVHIQGDADALWVKTSRGDDFVTSDPEQDFAARLHMPLPVLSMRYWMRGIPDPTAAYDKQVDAQGELTQLTQRGWQVEYQAYAVVQGYSLPARLTLTRNDVRIKLVLDTWTLPTAQPPASP